MKLNVFIIVFIGIVISALSTCSIISNIIGFPEEAKVLWRADFEDGDLTEWTFYDDVEDEISNWFVDQGYLIQHSNIGEGNLGTNAVSGNSDWTDYTVSAHVVTTDDDYIGVLFRYQDPDNYYRFSLSSQVSKIRLEKRLDGKMYSLGLIEEMWPECRFNISIDVQGDSIKIYLDNQKYFAIADTSFDHGMVGFSTYHNDASFFDDITVYDRLEIKRPAPVLQFDRGPYLQNVLGDSAIVMWRTTLAQSSQVEFGRTKTETIQIGNPDLVLNHKITLRGLNAGEVYVYRVISGTLVGEWGQFRAAKSAGESYRFALYGDNRTNFLRHKEIVAGIAREAPDFIINSGDVIMSGLRPDWDTEYFEPLQDLIKTTPVYIAIGNHENNTLYDQKYEASPDTNPNYSRYYREYFSVPEAEHETYYSFNYGNAFFVFIDNNLAAYSERDFPEIQAGSAQYNWLEEQLKSPAAQTAEWLLVSGHIPIFSAGTSVDYPLNREHLWPLFKKYEVDMYFSGHIHDYERDFSDGIHHILTGGGGGPQNTRVQNQADIRHLESNYHYCVVDVDSGILRLSFKDRYQNLMDELTIDKNSKQEPSQTIHQTESLGLHIEKLPTDEVPILIRLTLPEESDYRITIYNDSGHLIKHLVNGHAGRGTYWLHWKKVDEDGVPVPGGDYTCLVETANAKSQVQIKI